jgi:hypothetical protein
MGILSNVVSVGSTSPILAKNFAVDFTSWVSDVINISPDNKQGIVTIQFNTSSAVGAGVKIAQSLEGLNWDYVRDSNGDEIEIILSGSCTIANVVNLHSTFIKLVGSTAGTGILATINILVK